jgi:UDP-GlcNAc3NAcA epimerase
MTIFSIVGARPQFIKAATVSRSIEESLHVEETLVHTGQHYDEEMSEIFFQRLDIPKPDYNLGIGSGTHGEQTGRMLEEIERVLLKEMPDVVLVYGDTNSTLAGALAAAKLDIPIAHVEAGLRSFNRQMPEEINRVLTDHASNLLFVPTQTAIQNLKKEGIRGEVVHMVGDVMYDAALYYGPKAKETSTVLDDIGLTTDEYILATIHRAENTDQAERLVSIFEALKEAAAKRDVVLPLHPRTRKSLQQVGRYEDFARAIHLIQPVGYLDMIALEKNAAVIVTDSGGVQKEAYFHKVPCLTVRDETEWIELVEAGWNELVPPDEANELPARIEDALGHEGEANDLYGRGNASQKVVNILMEEYA